MRLDLCLCVSDVCVHGLPGIAQVFASHGHRVSLFDTCSQVLEQVPGRLRENLQMLDLPTRHAEAVTTFCDLESAVKAADFVFEAGPEKLAIKQEIFARLVAFTSANAVLASNTSVIPITEIAKGVPAEQRHRVLGAHWWNPAPLIPLVEVVRTADTGEQALISTIDLLQACGKQAVRVNRDVPGFVGNRLQHALWREAQALISDGVCDGETVDLVVKNSFGLRLPVFGPIENADLVGLDLTQDIHEVVLADLSQATGPLPALTERVARGDLGAKSGRGFLEWPAGRQQATRERLSAYLLDVARKRNAKPLEERHEQE
ncbi:3-hydroxyacyl-CoA dehydrogenase family protein [Pseudomonas putida]|uniref:3-hydroxyacyl-CoA dehydrogenase family protein n=1 Tax=Pseudomonas putida TaxID=303 RepID=UPI002DBA23EE|nr:3-hydroxyacyl-CoA dehydrogenase NAD-binding domain-containing protein [Pseudomonas putida]WRW03109.1 3-hydroxyacyl-CoA dehydrogenase NAD-binding domain-containing protein [Pseudomonas putida]